MGYYPDGKLEQPEAIPSHLGAIKNGTYVPLLNRRRESNPQSANQEPRYHVATINRLRCKVNMVFPNSQGFHVFFSSEAKGYRSKKREQALLVEFRDVIDDLAHEAGGEVYWDRPLRDARRG